LHSLVNCWDRGQFRKTRIVSVLCAWSSSQV